jgi:hypothetical protein
MSRFNDAKPAADHDAFALQSALLGSAGTPLKRRKRRWLRWLAPSGLRRPTKRSWAVLAVLLVALLGLALLIAAIMDRLGDAFLL